MQFHTSTRTQETETITDAEQEGRPCFPEGDGEGLFHGHGAVLNHRRGVSLDQKGDRRT